MGAAVGVLGVTVGCGTQIQSEELRRGIESLESHAATGRLLAHDAALGRTRTPFARVEARELTEYAVILSVIVMPATFYPIVRLAGDPAVMGEHRSGPVARVLGWAYFALICVLAVVAPVLLVVTNGGGG